MIDLDKQDASLFEWWKIDSSGLLGFVLARLYTNEWNFKPEQDFNLYFRPYS